MKVELKRILYRQQTESAGFSDSRGEVIKLNADNSYRLEHRKTIFKQQTPVKGETVLKKEVVL